MVRKENSTLSFLLQRCWWKTIDGFGEEHIATKIGNPIPLFHGSDTWTESAAMEQFSPLLKQFHRGIAVTGYVFDGAVFGAMFRKCRARHRTVWGVTSQTGHSMKF